MGGFGSTYLAIRHPELFRGCAPSSAAHLSYPDTLMNEWIYRLHNENGGYHFSYNAGQVTKLFFTASGGFVPNLDIEPNHFELLWDTLGNFADTVFTKWQNFDCCNLINSITPEDKLSFFLTCGTNDVYLCYPPYLELSNSLENLGIDYQAYYHGSNHGVFNTNAHKIMSHWMDSLIAESYFHLDIAEPMIYNQATLHVYPNPFSTSTTIEYELTQPKNVIVKIFNQFGQQIERIYQGNNQSGKQQHIWDASSLPNGIYFIQVRAGQEVSTSKIVKMR